MGFVTNADTSDLRPLLVVQQVPWEGPHVIVDSFPGVPVQVRHPLDEPERTPLPDPSTIRGAVVMGGPMSANDIDVLPALADELAWLRQAVDAQLPILGICLGAQLLAKAAGATVMAGHPEIGVSPIEITEPHDPLAAHLFPRAHAMHWHGEQFTLPDGAVPLAKSAHTPVQAFRLGSRAWGMLFHLEVDDTLLDTWLDESTMAAEAEAALGSDYRQRLRDGLPLLDSIRARAVFDEFAKFCSQPRSADTARTDRHAYVPTPT
jgi:GMP synthase (glutamine-hydrolysing)